MRVKGTLFAQGDGSDWYRNAEEVDYRPNGEMFVRLDAGAVDIKDDGSARRQV